MYFPIIGARSFFVSSGTNSGLVMMAVASASWHAQVRPAGIRLTAVAMACCAVRASVPSPTRQFASCASRDGFDSAHRISLRGTA